jgi:hypothetical protein
MLRRGIRKQQESGDCAMTIKNLLPRRARSLKGLRRHLFCLAVVTLSISVLPGQVAQAGSIGMPAGSTVWMELESGACDNLATTRGDCIGSNVLGANPAGGIPTTTITESPGRPTTGSAQIYPDLMRSYVSSYDTTFLTLSMQDTYTVHGTAPGSFWITANFGVDGTASSVFNGTYHQLYAASVEVEIGAFATDTNPEFLEQYRVNPFSPASSNTWSAFNVATGSSPVQQAISAATSYSQTVAIGDTFSLAFGLRSALNKGTIDLLNTAAISFDLPEGVYLTSANGGTFGVATVPLPGGFWLLATALGSLGWRKFRSR